jgi:hypothetical protein
MARPINIQTLNSAKLRALIDVRAEADRQATILCCSVGLGQVRFNDLAAIAEQDDRPQNRAAAAAIKTWAAYREAQDELERRYKYHGGTGPIKP